MLVQELRRLVDSTSDSAFAVDGSGRIVAWNAAAEDLFGVRAAEVLGRRCGEVLQGADECGPVCSHQCSVQQAVRDHHQIRNFDLQVQTAQGPQWCNVSVLVAEVAHAPLPYSIHILRAFDTGKRLELLVRNFVVHETGLPSEAAARLMASTRVSEFHTELTQRELQILRLIAKGKSTRAVSAQLHISRATVGNHVQHILKKLNAHTRLEAIRCAERAGLV